MALRRDAFPASPVNARLSRASSTSCLIDRIKLLAEFGRRVQATRERLEAALAQERQQLKEANELLAEAENQHNALETQRQAEQAAAKAQLQLERADKDTEKAENHAKALEAKVAELQQRAHQAEI